MELHTFLVHMKQTAYVSVENVLKQLFLSILQDHSAEYRRRLRL